MGVLVAVDLNVRHPSVVVIVCLFVLVMLQLVLALKPFAIKCALCVCCDESVCSGC